MINSIFFNIFYILWTVIVGSIFAVPVLIKQDLVFKAAIIWSKGITIALKYLCGINLQIDGLANVKEPCVFAVKHQSALETIVFNYLIKKPVFVLKKELLNIPIFGFYVKKCGMIAIDRGGGIKSLKFMLNEAKEKIAQGRSIVIFPEGTRTAPGEKKDYNPGIVAFYNLPNISVVPVALNTGLFWGKNSFIKKPGTYTIAFLPPIETNLPKDQFLQVLQQQIDQKSLELL